MKKLICAIFGHKESEPVIRESWRGVYCERCFQWLIVGSNKK